MMQSNKFDLNLNTEEILHHVAACAPTILWGVDNNGIIFLSEGRALNELGVKPGELVGQSVFVLYAEQPKLLDYIKRTLAGESFVKVVDLYGIIFENHYAPIRTDAGDIEGMIGVSVDITKHANAEKALRESEVRSKFAQKAGQVGIWEWNIQTNEVYWSETIEEMFGLNPGGFEGSFDKYMYCIHPDDRAYLNENIKNTLEKNSPYRVEHRVLWPDGCIHWIYGAGEVFRDDDGNPLRMMGIAQDITERYKVDQELRDSQLDLELSQELAHIGSWSWDINTNLITWSKELYRIYGYDPNEYIGNLLGIIINSSHPDDRERVKKSIINDSKFMLGNGEIEYRIVKPDGSQRIVKGIGKGVRDKHGKIIRRVGIIQDVTDKVLSENTMRKQSRALEQTEDLVMITDCHGCIEFVNQAFENTTGYSHLELLGKNPRILNSGEHDQAYFNNMWKTILEGKSYRDVMLNIRKDGTFYFEEKTISPLTDNNGVVTHFISTGKDVTSQIEDQKRMRFLAHHDVLTELPNRALFSDRLEHALDRRRESEEKLALIFIDLDRFKIINDTLGHEAGDRLLESLSKRLLECQRKEDTVARLGGDEFAVLLEDIKSIEEVASIARKLISSLSTSFILDNHELFVTASLGISIFPEDGTDTGTLLKHADIAMYRAKDLGRNTYQFYSSDMSSKAFQRLTVETSLRQALEKEEFNLLYQPQFDVNTGRVFGVEALLRWQHPEFGNVSPSEFIPILEETGQIIEVGAWVLRQACTQAAYWNNVHKDPIRISVNVSTRQFSSTSFNETLNTVLSETGLDPKYLEIEITESILLANTPNVQQSFDALLDKNVRLALDDFGTGYSSLSYLKRFPISMLKIDRSFIRDITMDPDDANIVEAIIALANSMNIQVIAEGVETEQQQAFLGERGCNAIQGYLYSPPVPAEELATFI